MNKKNIFPLFVLIIVLTSGILAWQFWSKKSQAPSLVTETPIEKELEKLIKNKNINWKTYNTGQEVMGFSLNIPTGWVVNSRTEISHDKNVLSRINFDFLPPGKQVNKNYHDWMGWGSLSVDVFKPQPNIDKWLNEYLLEFKEDLVVITEEKIDNKPVFLLSHLKSEGLWIPRLIVLGSRYSYTLGFSQDGASDFIQMIKDEIFPYIEIE